MDRKPPEVEFRCPDDGSAKYKIGKEGQISCKSCKREWAKKEVWQPFVLIRRFVSPLDHGYYFEKAENAKRPQKPKRPKPEYLTDSQKPKKRKKAKK